MSILGIVVNSIYLHFFSYINFTYLTKIQNQKNIRMQNVCSGQRSKSYHSKVN